eukprot:41146_1
MAKFKVGAEVNLTSNRVGVIRYEGPLRGSAECTRMNGIFYGIELTKGRGAHSGSYNGTKYFTCKPFKGVFVHRNQILSLHDKTSVSKIIKQAPRQQEVIHDDHKEGTQPQPESNDDNRKVETTPKQKELQEKMTEMEDEKEWTQRIQSINSSLKHRKKTEFQFEFGKDVSSVSLSKVQQFKELLTTIGGEALCKNV